MRRIFILVIISALMVVHAVGQAIVYGDKPGWSVNTTEDDFTGKKSYSLRYYDNNRRLVGSFFPGTNRLAVLEWYDGKQHFEVTNDAVKEHSGHIADEEIDYEWFVTMPNGDSRDDIGTVKMTFGEVDNPEDIFFGTFAINMDVHYMKQGSTIAVRWKDPMTGRRIERKMSLSGFTRCYNECLRLYGVKK